MTMGSKPRLAIQGQMARLGYGQSEDFDLNRGLLRRENATPLPKPSGAAMYCLHNA